MSTRCGFTPEAAAALGGLEPREPREGASGAGILMEVSWHQAVPCHFMAFSDN